MYLCNYREFLGGFRKRKLERKRKAQEQLQKQLKEEQKKIKQAVSVKCIVKKKNKYQKYKYPMCIS